MFIALDESKRLRRKIVGGILLDRDFLADFEKKFVSLRLEHKLFGEIKWNNINQYYNRYLKFLDIFFDEKRATFHAICYRDEKQKYRAAYVLLRTISWKIQNAGISKPMFVLFDNDGSFGKDGTEKIREYAPKDIKFKCKLDFCNQGESHVLGILQLSDILTGAVCAVVNGTTGIISENKKKVVDYITKKNNNCPINFSDLRLPGLFENKIHYFDPDNKP